MSNIGSYTNRSFSENQKFLVLDPSTGTTSLVLGSDLVSYITPQLNAVNAESTRLAAENTDYAVGEIIQTSGSSAPGDNFAAVYLVVEGGTGNFPMINGNDLLVIRGDEFLREQLIQNTAGVGSDLVAHTGTSDTVTEALDKRVIRKASVAEIEAITGVANYQVSLSGLRAGIFEFDSSDLSTEVTADTQQGFYIAPSSDATGASGAWVRQSDAIADIAWFGLVADGVSDDTTDFQAAMDLTASLKKELVISEGTYLLGPLTVPSDLRMVVRKNVAFNARSGFGANDKFWEFDGASDVHIDFDGAVCTMPKGEYTTGEQRHCFNIVNCSNVTVLYPHAVGSGGDGFYFNNATNTTVVEPIADNNRRQGISIIRATDLNVIRPLCKNTTGTAPEAGIDIEPNLPTDELVNIVIDHPVCTGNSGSGIQIFATKYATGSPDDVSITIISPVTSANSGYGYRINKLYLDSGSFGGFIKIIDPVSIDDGLQGLSILDKAKDGPFLSITNPVILNPCTLNLGFPDYNGVYIADTSLTVTGGIDISNLTVSSDNVGMDYGLWVEAGQGFTDVRVSVNDIKGHQVLPVRWNNITPTIADATTFVVDVDKIISKSAQTASLQVIGNYAGSILTNLGAAGSVTFFLDDTLPIGNKYRFQVEEAQPFVIDVQDSADRIVGTTAAGQTVSTSAIGEAAEAEYIGTFGGVKYWRVNILGSESNWTFA